MTALAISLQAPGVLSPTNGMKFAEGEQYVGRRPERYWLQVVYFPSTSEYYCSSLDWRGENPNNDRIFVGHFPSVEHSSV